MLFFRDSVREDDLHQVDPVRLDQLPVDRVLPGGAEQLVDVRVADVDRVTVEREALPVPDPGQQLEPEQVRERVHGVALTLGVGVDRVRLSVGRLS
jgi:hypothetical protein